MPPQNIVLFFCEIKWEDRIAEEYPFYVVERLIENGDTESVRWVRERYGDAFIRQVVCRSRNISRRTARYWQVVLNIPEEQILCLSKSWVNRPNRFWPD
ncbi:MAG: hypothetical protein N3D11_00935 [Candidatus Sumerlaeia bacterium]|nr:hypothetical protein [Candidatus Sumerlaeia bacterium]